VAIGVVMLVTVPVAVYLLTITLFNKLVNEGSQSNQGVSTWTEFCHRRK
jgi:hypothetical protein